MRCQLLIFIMFAVFVAFSATVSMANITDGLVAYWPLNDGFGKVAKDATGNGHDGTLEDGPTWTGWSALKQ